MKSLLKIENFQIGKIIERTNRFVVKAKINNKIVFTHLNNTGRLEEFVRKGKLGIFLPIKGKKTKFRLSMIIDENSQTDTEGTQAYAESTNNSNKLTKKHQSILNNFANSSHRFASASIIDTSLQMKCFEIALEKNYISWLKEAKILKRNFKASYTNSNKIKTRREWQRIKNNISLIDYLIEYKNKKYLLEVKSAVMKKGIYAMYPDCPSIRGQKHIKELINHQNSIILFIAGMKNIKAFKPNKDADPKIYKLLKIARQERVQIKAIQIYFDLKRKEVILKDDNLKVKI